MAYYTWTIEETLSLLTGAERSGVISYATQAAMWDDLAERMAAARDCGISRAVWELFAPGRVLGDAVILITGQREG